MFPDFGKAMEMLPKLQTLAEEFIKRANEIQESQARLEAKFDEILKTTRIKEG